MKNIVELREEISATIKGLKDRTLDVKTASELNNCAGKLMGTLNVQLKYHALRKDKPEIEFLAAPQEK